MVQDRRPASTIERASAELDYRRINGALALLQRYVDANAAKSPDCDEALNAVIDERDAIRAMLKSIGLDRRARFENLLQTLDTVLPDSPERRARDSMNSEGSTGSIRRFLAVLLGRSKET